MAIEILLDIDDIFLAVDNPRFETLQKNQRSALEKITDTETLELASHIAKHGLNPLEKMAVYFNEELQKYVTAEGNRRLAALKLISNFSLLDSLGLSKNKTSIIKSTPRETQDSLKTINCVKFNSKAEPGIWIKLKHTGKNNGVGTVQWDREQRQRFDLTYQETKPLQLQTLDFLRENFKDDQTVLAKINDELPLSALERLIGDPYVREFLGLAVEDKRLYATLEKNEVLKAFKKVIHDLTNTDKDIRETTRTLGKKADRKRYVESFKSADVLPDHKNTVVQWRLDESESDGSSNKPTAKKPKPATISTEKRTKLLTPSCALTIVDNNRINDIYHNLKSGLDVDKFANAVSVLARIFIEMSVNYYLIKFMNKTEAEVNNQQYKLSTKLDNVVNDLAQNNKLAATAKQAVNKELGNTSSAFHPNSLNAFVHNPNYSPSALDLKQRWNNVEPLIVAIWS